jgi:hypothetical protein
MENSAAIAGYVFLLRIAERLTLSVVVVIVALVVTIAFWRSVQKIDLSLGQGGLAGSANMLVATPVLALGALIGFAWVSFSNPITVSATAAPAESSVAQGESVTMAGMLPGRSRSQDPPLPEQSTTDDREHTRDRLMYVNCLARAPAAATLPQAENLLTQVRLDLMRPVWASDWGSQPDFSDWATGKSSAPPNSAARAFFEGVHPLCTIEQ